MFKFEGTPTRAVRWRNQTHWPTKYLLAGFILTLFGVYNLSRLQHFSCLPLFRFSKQATGEPGAILWGPCPGGVYTGIDCGSIVVPKDYFNPSAGTSTIAIARQNATKHKKGSVFLNPGGPGGSGVNLLLRAREHITELLGDQWDLIGFDPRGIGQSTPATKCFSSALEAQLFVANTVIEQGITVSSISNLSSPLLRDQLIEQHKQFLALKKSQAESCGTHMGDELRYMGTATVVRDMNFMSQVFDGEGAKINYWGGSYGSILGAYLVNMLPHRIGYAVIDGIVNPIDWSSEPSHKWPFKWLSSTEKTYRMYLEDCSRAGPSLCPLTAYQDEPWEHLAQRLEQFFDHLAVEPLATPSSSRSRPGYLTSGAARGLLLIHLERPGMWPASAKAFAEAMAGNGTQLHDWIVPPSGISHENDAARLAVTCLDSPPPGSVADVPSAEDLADEGLRTLREVSPHFGMSVGMGEPDGGCQYWPAEGPERFTGPWNATLDIPMLVISNTADPVTPISSGVLINSLMPNSSVLVIQEGPGHTSISMVSLCTMKLQRQYMSEGIVPANGTRCAVDNPTFPEPGFWREKMKALSPEDAKLVKAVTMIQAALFEGGDGVTKLS
ncbi:alpha/beta-hydrolase [Guyanagaster necrorhizus]|uniref:Alpha/beta-hydrolase n=1 Tax=Guyanagaster necrorhizus TaxID=856835 RepID=A0A9P8ATV0_9AGAR|nr:alpha/beta-hydrolase [Guyanagaster necrorhizus MCA 3950]KAG7447799.1 alpha/beta-hydrolase [Guyanagaster necrorhizus MCA 3950]